jgi:hypothetical protein
VHVDAVDTCGREAELEGCLQCVDGRPRAFGDTARYLDHAIDEEVAMCIEHGDVVLRAAAVDANDHTRRVAHDGRCYVAPVTCPAVWLSWKISSATAVALGVVWFVARRNVAWPRWIPSLAKEGSLLFLIYSVWHKLGALPLNVAGDALARGLRVWDAERWMHLPNEVTMQRWALHAIWFVQFFNVYYIVFHVAPLGIFLVWLYVRHRDRFPYWRNQLAFVSIVGQCIQFIPVAPPRFFPQLGFVDTAALYGPTVYRSGGVGDPGQLAAMPSMHVAWAMVVGIGAVTASRSRWRWLGALHALCTVLAVTLTAYHWLLDGIVATGLLLIGMGVAAGWNRAQAARRRTAASGATAASRSLGHPSS